MNRKIYLFVLVASVLYFIQYQYTVSIRFSRVEKHLIMIILDILNNRK